MTRSTPGPAGPTWVLVAVLALAGCAAPAAEVSPAGIQGLDPSGGPIITLLEDTSGLRVRHAVDIVLVGFDAGTAAALQSRLAPQEIAQQTGSHPNSFPAPPDLEFDMTAAPLVVVAEPRVVEVDADLARTYFAGAEEIEDGVYDANAAEAALVPLLAGAGVAPRPGVPTLVLLHAGDALPTDRAWRYTFTHGHLDGVRAFGEREDLLVMDLSAPADPFVTREALPGQGVVPLTGSPPSDRAYDLPLAPGGEATLQAMVDLVQDVSAARLLKSTIYPVSTAPCHHVTLILAVDTTSITDKVGRPALDWMDAAALEASFENLTGEHVLVDTRTLELPLDDPVLSTLARGAGSFVTLDALRWYVNENFERFVDLSEGCEEYLTINFFGDMGHAAVRMIGIAAYDVTKERRVAFGFLPDWMRLVEYCRGGYDPESPHANVDCNNVNYLFAHETGHLFGLWHTQHAPPTNGKPSHQTESFTSVWSTMGYRVGQRLHDFGTVDHDIWARNRAGFAVQQAQQLGIEDTPAFAEALDAFARYDWNAGAQALAPHLAPAREPRDGSEDTRLTWTEDLSFLFEEGHAHDE